MRGHEVARSWRRFGGLAALWLAFAFAPELAINSPRPFEQGAVGALVYGATAVGSFFTWWLVAAAIAAVRARTRLGWIAVVVAGPFGTLLTVGSIHYRRFFGLDVRPIAIAYFLENPRYAASLVDHSLTTGARLALFGGALFAIVALALVTARPYVGRARPPRWTVLCALAPIALVSIPRARCTKYPAIAEVRGVRALLQGAYTRGTEPVHALPVPRRLTPRPPAPARAPDVLVIVNESLAADALGPWNGQAPAPSGLMALLERRAGSTVWFPDAVAVSPLTAISVPSTLTGLRPDAPVDDFARAPLLWHEARARGYRTAFFSPQDFQVDFFEGFYLADGGPDESKNANDHRDQPRVNDRGIPDSRAVDDAIDFVARAPRDVPILLVVQMNATHWPCWAPELGADTSESAIPGRCARAARYIDDELARLVGALGRSRDPGRTVVIGTSDHGQSLDVQRPARPVNYYQSVLRVPLFVHLPESVCADAPELCAALRENRTRRASNLDVLPTVLDLWSSWPVVDERPPAAGASLLRPLPGSRVMLAIAESAIGNALADGFALFDGKWKWIIDEFHGVRLFDLEADPSETKNLAAAAPPAAYASLRAELRARPRALDVCRRVAPGALDGPWAPVSW